MLWSSRYALLICVVIAGACDFAPVYGPQGAGHRLHGRVIVEELTTPEGYWLVRAVESRLGRARIPRYTLTLELSSRQQAMAITAENITARFDIFATVDYTLRDASSGEIVRSGQVENFTGYSALGNPVSTLAIKRDAERRLMEILADQLTARLLAYAAELPGAGRP